MRFIRLKQTYALQIPNKELTQCASCFIQLTLKEPFWYPKIESMFNNGSWIAGWLFFYFGVIYSHGGKA